MVIIRIFSSSGTETGRPYLLQTMRNDYYPEGEDEVAHEEMESVGLTALLFFAVPIAVIVLLVAILV
jgi:hypothetical protein